MKNWGFFSAALSRDDVRDRKIKEIMSKKEFKDILDVGYSKKAVKMAAEELFKQKGNETTFVEKYMHCNHFTCTIFCMYQFFLFLFRSE